MSHSLIRRARQNAATLGLGAFILTIICLLGFVFYIRGSSLMRAELRERLRTMAAISALQFSAEDLDELHTIDDIKKPVYAKLVRRLDAIREQNPDIRFTYILRPVSEGMFEFAADADSLYPEALKDLNGDGVLDDEDQPAPPGTPYEVDDEALVNGLKEPSTNEEPYSDQWGTYMSGFAPIRRADGTTAAVLGVDIDAGRFTELSQRIFSPVVALLAALAGVFIAGYFVLSLSERKVQELKRMEAARAGLLRLTYHQLGQPLTILKWSIETLRDAGLSSSELKNQMGNLDEVALRMDGIFQALGKADRVHRGEVQYTAKPISLDLVVQEVAATAKARLERRRHALTLSIEQGLTINLDHSLITGVLSELLGNAMDYSPEGSPIEISARHLKDSVRITVTDHGVGIPEAELSRITGEFYRASNSAKMKPDGNGLGLFIARGIAMRAGGDLWIESTEGKGTSVTFTLPMNG